jgi:CHASE2 domain-containing sensor protein
MSTFPKLPMNPLLAVFLKLTALVAIGIVALVVAGFILKIVVVAALIAALVIAGFFVYSFFRRRSRLPVIR